MTTVTAFVPFFPLKVLSVLVG